MTRIVSEDGETVTRELRRHGITWHVMTDPAESRWFTADGYGAVIRGYRGWAAITYRPSTEVATGVTFVDAVAALKAALGKVMSMAEETIYAVRRTDNELIYGEFSYLEVGGPGDWSAFEDDIEFDDPVVTYEMVKMTVEVLERRSLPR